MKLSDRIIQYRAKENLSQQGFADKCGVSKQTIYSIENETQEPSRVTLAKIELVLNEGKEGQE